MESLLSLPQDLYSTTLLLKEAVYSSVALCSHDLYDYLNFDEWAVNCLFNETLIKIDEYYIVDYSFKIVKRRISNIMGRWVSVKCAKESRTILYQSLLQLLNAQEDLVVRMTAVSDLGKVVDDFDFDITYFTPFLQQFVDLLMELLLKVDEFDSRLKIINSLIIIIERMDGQMLPSVVQLIQIIPDLWNRSADQHMFRNSIVTILTKLVQSLRQESHQLHPIVVPIIKESLNTSSVICN